MHDSFGHADTCTRCPMKSRGICQAIRAGAAVAGCHGPRIRKLEQDWILQDEGEAPKLTGILRRGYLRTERILEDGRRCIVGLAVPSDPIGAWLESSGNCTVSAATEIEICAFDPQHLRRQMARDPALRMEILRAAAEQHARQLELVWRRGALNSRERIIAFLVMAAEIMQSEPLPDGGIAVSIPISRRDWADITNTTVETICRTLGQLGAQTLVESVAPGRYRIPDLEALAREAGIDPDLDRWANCRGTSEATGQVPKPDLGLPTLPRAPTFERTTLNRAAVAGRAAQQRAPGQARP
jgi:CRP-like cAMP-binding protein